ncbi:basal body-orientation factor 1 [Morus bassanus]
MTQPYLHSPSPSPSARTAPGTRSGTDSGRRVLLPAPGGSAAAPNGNAAGFSAAAALTPLPDTSPPPHPGRREGAGRGLRRGGGRSLCRGGTSTARRAEEERDEVDAALRGSRLAATEASRAEYREAARRLAGRNAELLRRRQRAEREAAAVAAFPTKHGRERAEEVCAQAAGPSPPAASPHSFPPRRAPSGRPCPRPGTTASSFAPPQHEGGGDIAGPVRGGHPNGRGLQHVMRKTRLKLGPSGNPVTVFCKTEKLKQELIDLKQQVQEEKKKLKRLEGDVEKKQIMMAEAAQREAVLQLNSTGRELFKENVRLHCAFAYQLKETMELQKIKQKLEKDKTLLLQEKETHEGLIQKKILQINRQKAQIRDLQRKVEKLETALCHRTRESVRETQKTQHQALTENQASMVEIKKLQQLLEMKDQEMNRVKKLARNILNERTEVERFFLDALEHVKQEIISSRKHYKKKAQTAYYRKMMEACAGKEEFPKIKTFKSNITSTNSVYRDLEEAEKCYWEKIQFEKVDISELTWEQKERVLRLLFAKMNGTNPWKYTRVLATSTPAPDDTKEESKIG